jgi:thymidylate synthase
VQADLQLTREPLPLPRFILKRKPASVFEYQFEDFELLDYYAHGSIKAPIAV